MKSQFQIDNESAKIELRESIQIEKLEKKAVKLSEAAVRHIRAAKMAVDAMECMTGENHCHGDMFGWIHTAESLLP